MEIVLRMKVVSSTLAVPSFGSEHHQFEIQLARLEAIYQERGSIDCIFVGDSLTWLDLDPLSFSDGYFEESGKRMECFNFGVASLPAVGVSVITGILVDQYHPQLIVYGLHANSLVVGQDSPDARVVLDTPWVRFKSGDFSFSGWFYANSHLVRYFKTLNLLIRLDRAGLENELGDSLEARLGFDAKTGQRIDLDVPPSRSDPADIPGFEKYYEYQVYPENMTGILDIAKMTDQGTTVIMVMMPVHRSFYAFFKNGEQDYSQIANAIEGAINDTNTTLLRSNDEILIPEDGWWDYSHLNITGAQLFSHWLGGEVAKARLD